MTPTHTAECHIDGCTWRIDELPTSDAATAAGVAHLAECHPLGGSEPACPSPVAREHLAAARAALARPSDRRSA